MDYRIINGNCIDVLARIDSQSIDCLFADPPYGNGTPYKSYDDTRENLTNLVRDFMPQALRVAKRVVITPGVKNMFLYPEPTWTLAWVNQAGIAWGFCCWQPILVYGKDPYLQAGKGRQPDTYFQTKTESIKSSHPCPKPVNVMRWILERTSNEGDTILDPFCGSGITGVAAMQTDRNFIGIELDPTYAQIAETNIKQAKAQSKLFSIPKVMHIQTSF